MYCTNCGAKINDTAKFCEECGAKINKPENHTEFETFQTAKPDDEEFEFFNAYIQGSKNEVTSEQQEHYQKAFKNIKSGKITNWNWSQFLFGYWHFFYRKSYLYGFLLIIIGFFFNRFVPFFSLIVLICRGLFGDYFIYQTFKSKYTQAKSNFPTKEEQLNNLRCTGGVNKFVIAIGFVLSIIQLALIILGALLISSSISIYNNNFYDFIKNL